VVVWLGRKQTQYYELLKPNQTKPLKVSTHLSPIQTGSI
jgi:hypothetical protein